MRSTNEILIAIKDSEPVEKEELRMACLVLDALLFFARKNITRLLKGGIGADCTKKDFPGAYAELGISQMEFNAMKKDPVEFLGADHIPGTPEYEARYKVSKAVFKKVMEARDGIE